MALLDFLKRKENTEKAKKAAKKTEKSTQKVKPIEADKKPEPISVAKSIKTKTGSFAFEAIKQPHISEKATYLSEKDQYVFEISPNYNKNEVKKAIEGIYGVNVLSVNMIKIPPKKRRIGRTEGFRKGYSKAIVRIKEGQKIEIL